jgi:hypothetical protein
MISCRLVCVVLISLSVRAPAQSPLPELRDLDLTGWDCLTQPAGVARTQDGNERNVQKNRSPVKIPAKVPSLDFATFLTHAADYDNQIERKHRRDMTPEQKAKVTAIEKQIVSVTGWLVLAYQGVPETTNCRSKDFLDWHLELSPAPSDHAIQAGDPTPIICEITPRTQALIYRSGVRIRKLAAFLRLPDSTFVPTGSKPHKIRVTGPLLWDDEHNKADSDIGAYVEWFSAEGYHHPWRATAWEVHPVLKIEDLGTE